MMDKLIARFKWEPQHIGYKACYVGTTCVIVKLEILGIDNENRTKRRFPKKYAKHRCEKAKVLDIWDPVTMKKYHEAESVHDPDFKYRVGKIVEPLDSFDMDLNNECSTGIHYFLTYECAIGYHFTRRNRQFKRFTGDVIMINCDSIKRKSFSNGKAIKNKTSFKIVPKRKAKLND